MVLAHSWQGVGGRIQSLDERDSRVLKSMVLTVSIGLFYRVFWRSSGGSSGDHLGTVWGPVWRVDSEVI